MSLTYLWHELRRRWTRTLVTALGLAAGVGLVMGIIGVSSGLSVAQNRVLSPLGSVGTSIIVTRTIAPTTSTKTTSASSASSSTPAKRGGFAGGFFARGVGGATAGSSEAASLLNNNSSVITDLAKLGPAGTHFDHTFLLPGTLITFPSAAVTDVAKIPGVTNAVGALSLEALHETGTVPKITASITTGGQTIDTTVTPPTITPAERQAEFACLEKSGLFAGGFGHGGAAGGAGTGAGSGGAAAGGRPGGFANGADNPAFLNCLPPAQKAYIQKVVVPEQTITKVLNPPTTNTATSTFTVGGVDAAKPTIGLVTKSQLVAGQWFGAQPADEVLVNDAYANTHHLKVGSTVTINSSHFSVVGLVNPTLTGNVADYYFDLPTLQKLASADGYVNEVLVAVKNSSDVGPVAAAIKKELPGATILTSKSLADQVSGSLANAHKLANDLGGALAVVVLLAAFLIAGLLTLSSVAKRVREIGSLRAIGWSRGAIVRQLVGETLAIGVLGGIVGVAVGAAVCLAIGAVGPGLSVTSTGLAVGASSVGQLVHQSTTGTVNSVVHLTAPIHASTIVIAFLGALLGGLVAGAFGAWRAVRLAPATALRDLG